MFYKNAELYWAKVPPTIDGVLGGFGYISEIDIAGSRSFLKKIYSMENPPGTKLALDCGAGIGRISKDLLMDIFEKVDMVEQDQKFICAAKHAIGESNAKLGSLYNTGLQNFKPFKKYDVIWCQWVLGHLNDDDLLAFLKRCSESLTDDGVIIVKENITSTEEMDYDEADSSVTRPYRLMQRIFDVARLKVIRVEEQIGFPDDIYPVYMFALVPILKYPSVLII